MEEEEAPDEGNVSVTPFRLTADRFPIIPCKPETPRAGPKDVGGDGREGSNEVKVLMHEEVSTESIINARSTLSWDSKNSSLMQQVLRILLLNCMKVTMGSRSVSHMMLGQQYSGYNQRFGTELIKSAINEHRSI